MILNCNESKQANLIMGRCGSFYMQAVIEILVPVLSTYWDYLSVFLGESPPVNATHHSDALNVLGALRVSVPSLFFFFKLKVAACHWL